MEVAFSSLQEAIVWTDQDGQIQWCNQALISLVGGTRINLIGRNRITSPAYRVRNL